MISNITLYWRYFTAKKDDFDILALSGWATLDSKTSKRALRTLFRYLIIEETWSRQKEEELNCAVWISNCILFFAFWILILGFSISDLALSILHCVFRLLGCTISLDCFFSHCVFSNGLPLKMQSHTGFICLTFLPCVFLNVSSNGLPVKMQSHIGCICFTFLHCVFSNVSSNRLPEKRQSYIVCICLTFLHCAF